MRQAEGEAQRFVILMARKKGKPRPARVRRGKIDVARPKAAPVQTQPTPVLTKPVLSGAVREIALGDVRLNDESFRFRLDLHSPELERSLKEEGQQFPIVVRGAKAPYQLICGFRRVTALKQLGRDSVKALIVPHLTDDEALRLSLLENMERAPLSDLDVANVVAKLKVEGKKEAQIARLLRRSVRQVQRYMQVSSFPPELKRAIASRKIAMGHGLVLNKAVLTGSRIDLNEWVERIAEKKLSVPELRRLLAQTIGGHRRVEYFRKRGRGFRLAAFQFDPTKTTPEERKQMLAALRRAIETLTMG
jgi:ParB family chromosome partitioning protein